MHQMLLQCSSSDRRDGRKILARAENYKVYAEKAQGVGWQNLGCRDGTDCVQCSDGYEKCKME